MGDFFNNIFWVVLGGVLFFFYENIQIDRRAELEAAHGYHVQRAGIASFQDYIQKQEQDKDLAQGDFVLQDRLSDWRTWMKNKDENVPHEFAQQPAERQLTPIEEAQARLRELEESVQKEEEPEARTPVPIVDGKPLSMKEILDRQGIEVEGGKDEPLIQVQKEAETKEAAWWDHSDDKKATQEATAGEKLPSMDELFATGTKEDDTNQEEGEAAVEEEKPSLDDLFSQPAPQNTEETSDSKPASLESQQKEIKEETAQEASRPQSAPTSISGEEAMDEPLPKFLIIGSTKCSTSALLRFLNAHPQLRSPGETYFFNKHYDEGIDYYKSLFEKFNRPGMVLFDKTPTYYTCVECPKRVKELNPEMKIIMSVCDPVHRIVSRYYHAKDIGGPRVLELGENFEDYQKNIILAERNATEEFNSLELNGRDRTTAVLEDLFIPRKSPFKKATLPFSITLNSAYAIYMQYWLRYFPKEQLYLVNGNRMSGEPFNVLEEIEEFLGVEKFLLKEKFVTNEKTGFYCFEKDPGLEPICLSDDKSRSKLEEAGTIVDAVAQELEKFYAPFNSDLRKIWPDFDAPWIK
ncbi:Oidioi.mRNA.OKI2018_I69.XSR.g16551.t1.cds [Oikopleura dioica]|uniref:Sulfotransferase n=1 Tax=Oikopleura dioica TaxID=34765 RepID=A0ABN7SKG4_OIKDI|nr:Oidioi.mRNA.OKI2018_I69.XSR.g16551.t1.cds [Oikopleura dioica]